LGSAEAPPTLRERGCGGSNRRGPKIWGMLGACDVAWLTSYKHTPPHMNYLAEFCRSMLNGINVIKDIRLKIWLRVPTSSVTQGHG